MYDLQYFFAKLRFKIRNEDTEVISDFFRKYGMKVGTGCKIYSNLLTPESYLVTIGDNVSISNDVQIITHDNSISKVYPEYTDVFFRVTIR
jgi:acetyltransferase-like isoleucine patch superfamily enzyme